MTNTYLGVEEATSGVACGKEMVQRMEGEEGSCIEMRKREGLLWR
jgi:hypothetical protein